MAGGEAYVVTPSGLLRGDARGGAAFAPVAGGEDIASGVTLEGVFHGLDGTDGRAVRRFAGGRRDRRAPARARAPPDGVGRRALRRHRRTASSAARTGGWTRAAPRAVPLPPGPAPRHRAGLPGDATWWPASSTAGWRWARGESRRPRLERGAGLGGLGRQRAAARGRRALRGQPARRRALRRPAARRRSKARARRSRWPPPTTASRSATARACCCPGRACSRPSTACPATRPWPSPRASALFVGTPSGLGAIEDAARALARRAGRRQAAAPLGHRAGPVATTALYVGTYGGGIVRRRASPHRGAGGAAWTARGTSRSSRPRA